MESIPLSPMCRYSGAQSPKRSHHYAVISTGALRAAKSGAEKPAVAFEVMPNLRAQIVRFVDEAFPGFIELEFRDAQGQLHQIIEKVPVVTCADLWSDSKYPQQGFVACTVLERIQNQDESCRVRITIAEPWGLETTSGESVFEVNEADLLNE